MPKPQQTCFFLSLFIYNFVLTEKYSSQYNTMSYFKKLILIAVATFASANAVYAEYVHITTPTTSMVVDANINDYIKFVYYGNRLDDSELGNLAEAGVSWLPAYPVYGVECQREPAMSVTHPDGNMTLDMKITGIERYTDKDGASIVAINTTDRHYPFDIVVKYRTYPNSEIIETWAEATNRQKGTVLLRQFASASMPVKKGDVWMSQFFGSWANETRLEEAPLPHGMVTIKNKDGARNTHTSHAEIMLSLDGQPREDIGRTIGAALCYTGNYEIKVDTDESGYHHFLAGINPDNSEYNLRKGETFVTPPVAFTYSEEGKGGVSRNFHRWGREHRLAHGDKPRKILLNSWEGVYLDIKEHEMHQMMHDIASMGGELFVMDDGWFGTKYPRTTDSNALGDWTVDTNKLPNGIQGLIDAAKNEGISFGIWIEPEMVNSRSILYEEHPEYIVCAENRNPRFTRGGTQTVLDLGNPKVQDLIVNMVDTLLTNYPEIDYIKWDSNSAITTHGSHYQTADKQSHLFIDYHRGLVSVFERIRAKFPDVTIQDCASGGGRANYGYLPYFDEFWVSDNTDALQRIYMQWGTSHFFPAIAMASHISASPNHQTGRLVPLKYRTDVAMSGRLGMEIQPKDMSDQEKEQSRRAIADYKAVRDVVQFGDLYRLVSPYDHKDIASLMYVTPEKDEAVFFWWKLEAFQNQYVPRVKMAGLDPNRRYRVTELNRIDRRPLSFEGREYTGQFLMSNGLEIPLGHDADNHLHYDYASRVLRLEAL